MIKPIAGYCLIEPIEAEKKTAGGLYLPETSEDKPMKGKVLEVGSEHLHESGKYISCPVKKGDVAYYKKWTNQEVEFEGKQYLLVAFNELLAILE